MLRFIFNKWYVSMVYPNPLFLIEDHKDAPWSSGRDESCPAEVLPAARKKTM